MANHSHGRIIDGLAFDWAMLVLGTIFLGGLYLDGWAHNHGRVDNSFFTVWHAFFYSGFGLVMLLLMGTLLWNHSRGMSWRGAAQRLSACAAGRFHLCGRRRGRPDLA
ncbi:MAG: hypothetical protein R2911_31080 [Caldilineaceae bacterium]